MLRNVLMGTAAGAAGMVALNVVTYADMAIRGRPSSSVPANVAGEFARSVGLDLAPDRGGPDESADEVAQHRRAGLGALFEYATGLGVGAAYGLVRPLLRAVPWPLAGVGLGLAAMAGSDVPAARLGVTDPTTWPASNWAADIVPHLAYGLVTALAYEAFTER